MKREAKELLGRSLDSLLLSIDHFNRPFDRGRHDAVLIFLDRSFELLLKAVIIERGCRIRERKAKQTMKFDKCIRKCISDETAKCLTEEEAFTIQTINTLRDAAQHYVVWVSEQHLYLYAQAGLSLYKKILLDQFGTRLEEYFPERVLPITTSPPMDVASVIDAEFADIKRLVAPGSRKRLEAQARLRALAIVEASLAGERTQPTDGELRKHVQAIQAGKKWNELFPGVASLRLDTTGTGLNVSLRITKSDGEPIRLVSEDMPDATIVGVRRVDELSFYSMNSDQLAAKCGLSRPRLLAVVEELSIKKTGEYFREFKIGSQVHKRYSANALDHIKKSLPALDVAEIWERRKPSGRLARR